MSDADALDILSVASGWRAAGEQVAIATVTETGAVHRAPREASSR